MSKSAYLLVFSSLLAACARPQTPKASSSVNITMPSAAELRSMASRAPKFGKARIEAMINFDLLCFAVNVTAPDITNTSNSCDINRGVFSGSIAPGGTLSLDVPSGNNRVFSVYGFLRSSSSAPCPTLDGNWGGFPLSGVYALGSSTPTNIQPPSASVSIEVTLPDLSQNIVVQNGWPNSCLASATPAPLPIAAAAQAGRIVSGGGLVVGSNLQAYSRISFQNEEGVLSGSHVQIHGWHADSK